MGFPFLADGVKMTVSGTPGTGAITLGAAVFGFRSLSGAGAPNGAVLPCYITDTGNAWEFALCTYNSTVGTLTRQVLWSSNANAAVNLTSAALVSMTIFAEHLNNLYDGGIDNPFHNAGCNVAQRGTGAITITTSGGFGPDGWWILPAGASVTAQQGGSIGSSLHSLLITGAAGVTDVQVIRCIESLKAAPFAGKTVVLQFKLYNNSGASITPSIVLKHPTTADTFSSLSSADSTTSAQACLNGATTLCSVAVPISASATNGLYVSIDLGALGASATVQISEIDQVLAPNAVAGLVSNPPAARLAHIDKDLLACYRHLYFVSNYYLGINYNSSECQNPNIGLPIAMRATPTILAGASFPSGGGTPAYKTNITTTSPNGLGLLNSAASWGSIGTVAVTFSGGFSAELHP